MIVIVLLKIRHGKTVTLGNIEKAFSCGVKVIGLSLDMRDSKGAALINERRLAALVKNSPVPILVKGILTRKNALQAVEAGVKGLLLSNRGGRILEYLPSDVEVPKVIKDAVGESALIIVDGGIRTGEDVFKALCLGADLVLIGRPLVIALAGAQEKGIEYVFRRIGEQLRAAMAIAGAKTIKDISDSMIHRMNGPFS